MRNFSGVIDPAETISAVSLTQLKFQIPVLGPQLFFIGNIPQNYFIGQYPDTIS
jgi:hypothetical protein